jgi:hypothetical protein
MAPTGRRPTSAFPPGPRLSEAYDRAATSRRPARRLIGHRLPGRRVGSMPLWLPARRDYSSERPEAESPLPTSIFCPLPSDTCYLLTLCPLLFASAFPPGRRPLWPLRAGGQLPHSDFLIPSFQLNIFAQASPPPSKKIRSQIDSCNFASTWFWHESKRR